MTIYLQFALEIEDDWPPVGSESMPFEKVDEGYRALDPPLFIKNLSAGDVIEIIEERNYFIYSWRHLKLSDRSTIWIGRSGETEEIDPFLDKVEALGCNTVRSEQLGCYAIDLPAEVSLSAIDAMIEQLDQEKIAVAFPSQRHPDAY